MPNLNKERKKKMAKIITLKTKAEKPSLERAQALVADGGLIELVELQDGTQLIVDEEGLLKGKDVNPIASLLANTLIVGEALHLHGQARWLD